MEEAGRALLPGPLFSTVALAGAVIDAVASSEAQEKISRSDLRGRCALDCRDS